MQKNLLWMGLAVLGGLTAPAIADSCDPVQIRTSAATLAQTARQLEAAGHAFGTLGDDANRLQRSAEDFALSAANTSNQCELLQDDFVETVGRDFQALAQTHAGVQAAQPNPLVQRSFDQAQLELRDLAAAVLNQPGKPGKPPVIHPQPGKPPVKPPVVHPPGKPPVKPPVIHPPVKPPVKPPVIHPPHPPIHPPHPPVFPPHPPHPPIHPPHPPVFPPHPPHPPIHPPHPPVFPPHPPHPPVFPPQPPHPPVFPPFPPPVSNDCERFVGTYTGYCRSNAGTRRFGFDVVRTPSGCVMTNATFFAPAALRREGKRLVGTLYDNGSVATKDTSVEVFGAGQFSVRGYNYAGNFYFTCTP